jgi:hypothetical protein
MTTFLSSTDIAIIAAVKFGTLRFEEYRSRFGEMFCAIVDDCGVIEVHDTRPQAESRVSLIAA